MVRKVGLAARMAALPQIWHEITGGDEVGLLNDYSFKDVPEHAHDNRWLHRPKMDWALVKKPNAIAANLLSGTKHIIQARKATPQLASQVPTKIIDTGNEKLFAFIRTADEGNLVGIFNFTDEWTNISAELLRTNGITTFKDALGGGEVTPTKNQITVAPYGRLWLT